MKRDIRPDQVKEGMYICGFGGSWIDHPFWRVRFILKKPKDVERIKKSGVPYVTIDEDLGAPAADSSESADAGSPQIFMPPSVRLQGKPALHNASRTKLSRFSSPAIVESARDLQRKQARALVSRSKKVMRHVFDGARLGKAVRIEEVLSIVEDVAESVERSPRTLLDIIRLKKKDEYTYLHSVAVCTLMVNAARFMGLPSAEVREYGLAGLLHDIGKMGIPEDVLNKAGKLTDTEFESVRNHPEHGYKLLLQTPDVTELALDVCRHHHERVDGTGYPFGLDASTLSVAAKLGAICDVYDALTSDRIYKQAWTPTQAIGAMWSWEGHFDRELLFTFMRSISVFPKGMLVQLRSNRLGIVLDNKRRNTQPHVLTFYSTRERNYIEPEEIVIRDSLAGDSIIAAADPNDWDLTDWEQQSERLVANQR